jgi:hypothetical protein
MDTAKRMKAGADAREILGAALTKILGQEVEVAIVTFAAIVKSGAIAGKCVSITSTGGVGSVDAGALFAFNSRNIEDAKKQLLERMPLEHRQQFDAGWAEIMKVGESDLNSSAVIQTTPEEPK